MGGFRKGDHVEVSSKENGFVGSWYAGVVVRKAARSCTVRYHTLVGDASDEPLQESVELPFLRPVPPAAPAPARFGYGEPVEVYDRDGWWVGVVTRVLQEEEDQEEQRYMVYFRESREESLYPHSRLRVRQDWLNGLWVRVFQKPNRDLEELRRQVQSPTPRKLKQIRGFGGLKRRLISDNRDNDDQENPGEEREEDEDEEPNNNINNDLQLSLGGESSHHSDEDDYNNNSNIHHHNSDSDNNNNNNNNNKLRSSKSPSDGVVEPSPSSHNNNNNNDENTNRKRRKLQIDGGGAAGGDAGDEQTSGVSRCKLRAIQLRAYSGVLKAFRCKGGGLTWHQEQLISDLRSQFDISNDFHIQQLEALDGWEPNCECSYCSCTS